MTTTSPSTAPPPQPSTFSDRMGTKGCRVDLRLLFLNAFLLRPVSLGIGPFRWEPGAAPAVADRAAELGRTVAGDYDVIALAEAFAAPDRDRILAGWPAGAPRPEVAVGPNGGWDSDHGYTAVGSGLATIVDGPRLTRTARHRYPVGGHRWADADPWAAKGVLMAEVDVGLPGRVEVYSTHLCAGGGLLPVGGDRVAGTDAVRSAQAADLAAFVEATHRPGNLVVVVGDMNVPERSLHAPDPEAPHRDLAAALSSVGLEDLWPTAGRGPGPTSGLERRSAALGVLDPDDARFACDDAAPTEVAGDGDGGSGSGSVRGSGGDSGPAPSERIDRVFLARPRPDDRVVVQNAMLRRRPFPRRADAPDRHRLAHLSDHLGLHLELALVPAPAVEA